MRVMGLDGDDSWDMAYVEDVASDVTSANCLELGAPENNSMNRYMPRSWVVGALTRDLSHQRRCSHSILLPVPAKKSLLLKSPGTGQIDSDVTVQRAKSLEHIIPLGAFNILFEFPFGDFTSELLLTMFLSDWDFSTVYDDQERWSVIYMHK
jgi:hypothetical protein